MTFGAARLVDVREGPNVRLSFDGGRVFYESPALRIDAFGVAPVVVDVAPSTTTAFRDKRSRGKPSGVSIASFRSEPFADSISIFIISASFVRMRRSIPASLTRGGRRWVRVSGVEQQPGTTIPKAYFNLEPWIRRYPCLVGGFQHRLYPCQPLGPATAGIAS